MGTLAPAWRDPDTVGTPDSAAPTRFRGRRKVSKPPQTCANPFIRSARAGASGRARPPPRRWGYSVVELTSKAGTDVPDRRQARLLRRRTTLLRCSTSALVRPPVADNSKIEWTEASWNPTTGCHKVSPGCAHCYAETFAERWRGMPGHPYEQGFDLKVWRERLELPLRWRRALSQERARGRCSRPSPQLQHAALSPTRTHERRS